MLSKFFHIVGKASCLHGHRENGQTTGSGSEPAYRETDGGVDSLKDNAGSSGGRDLAGHRC